MMPYIAVNEREALTDYPNCDILDAGELTYMITRLCMHYLDNPSAKNFAKYNSVIGALECAKQEFYRRVLVPYEDTKMRMNGDVY
jgi:hypothetical protein